MTKRISHKQISELMAALSFVAILNFILAIVSNIYGNISWNAPVDIALASLVFSFVTAVIALILDKRSILAWVAFCLSLLLIILVFLFIYNFHFKM